MMTWSLLQRFGVVASDEQQAKTLKDLTQPQLQQHQQKLGDKEGDREQPERDKDAPTKSEKETFKVYM